jgi:hypothetical protein
MSPERRILGLALAGLVLIALVSATVWFLANFERRTQEVPIGAAPEARRNPLLALERYLVRLEVPVESVPGRDLLWHPPDPSDTLLVRGLGSLSPGRRAALRAWMESGGRLVTAADEVWEEGDDSDDGHSGDFLADFGVRLRLRDPTEEDGPSEIATRVRLDGAREPLAVRFEPDRYLGLDESVQGAPSAGERPRLVSLSVGTGSLTVLSDTEWLANGRIGEHDHALLAVNLVLPGPGGKVWLLYDSAVPWLGAILWAAAPLALLSGGGLLAVWLWSLGARLGPLEPPPDRRRRDLLEHLDAAGAFLWRHGRASRLVEPARRRILADWERHRPELRRLDPGAQAAAIAQAVGRPAEAVADALTGQAEDASAFVTHAARLQDLWRSARPAHRGRTQKTLAGKERK